MKKQPLKCEKIFHFPHLEADEKSYCSGGKACLRQAAAGRLTPLKSFAYSAVNVCGITIGLF